MQLTLDTDTLGQIQAVNRGGGGVHLANSTIRNITSLRCSARCTGGLAVCMHPPQKFFLMLNLLRVNVCYYQHYWDK